MRLVLPTSLPACQPDGLLMPSVNCLLWATSSLPLSLHRIAGQYNKRFNLWQAAHISIVVRNLLHSSINPSGVCACGCINGFLGLGHIKIYCPQSEGGSKGGVGCLIINWGFGYAMCCPNLERSPVACWCFDFHTLSSSLRQLSYSDFQISPSPSQLLLPFLCKWTIPRELFYISHALMDVN